MYMVSSLHQFPVCDQYIYIYIYSPSSRLGKMINKDNRKRNDEDNAKNQLERSHKRMKTYRQSEDIQIQTYI